MITQDDLDARLAWLQALKAGDLVGVDSGISHEPLRQATVQLVTASRICLTDGRDFRRTGRQAGTFYGVTKFRVVRLAPWNDVAEEIRQAEVLAWHFKQLRWEQVPYETLQVIHGLLPSRLQRDDAPQRN